ncbi:MAG: ComEC family competence protein [Defluviitaleaceae bacterium]|nr:ComEC family competence protein [Defluviitaleaceae bacterium]
MNETSNRPLAIPSPIMWALGFLICGIIFGRFAEMTAISLGLVLGLGLFLCAVLYKVYQYKPVFIFLLFLGLGMWRTGHSLHNHTTEPIQVEFTGVVLDVGYTASANQRAVIRGIHPVTGANVRIMVYIRPHLPSVQLGQEVRIIGELRPLNTPANPGGYNQFQHLRSQKIDAVIWADNVERGHVQRTLMVVLRGFRDRMAAVYDAILPPREAGIIRSMVLGDRNDMDWDLADLYRGMGIFHILSISGLHVATLMIAANKLLGTFMDERRAGVIVLILMIMYCLLTGAAVATVRAVTMGGVLVAAKILYREYNLLVSVSWACIALLIYEPLYLFNAGFQLSFSAVFGMGILSAPIERALIKVRKVLPLGKNLRSSLSYGIAAVFTTYNVFMFHFYEIQLYSIIGNLIIMPTTSLILVLGVAVGLVGLVWMPAAMILSGAVYFILRFYELGATFFSALPHAMLLTGGRSLPIAAFGVTVLLLFAYTFHGYGADFRRRRVFLLISILAFIIAVFIHANPPRLHITALDTHGNYVVLRHRGDTLVIGAPRGGEEALLRYLDMRGVHRASLLLTESPRPQDNLRLERLTQRMDMIYLQDGDVRMVGNVRQQPIALPLMRQGLQVTFHDVNITIESSTLTIQNHYVRTAENGAVLLETNGRTVWVSTMRP